MNPLLQQAATLIAQVLRFEEPAATVLSRFFQEERIHQHQRNILAEVIFAGLRNRQKINAFFADNANTQETLAGSIYYAQLDEMTQLFSAENPHILQEIDNWQAGFSGSLNTLSELPEWLIEKLRTYLNDEQIIQLGQSMAQQAPLDVRVNTLKAKRDDILTQWLAEGQGAYATPMSPWGIRLDDKPNLQKHPFFINGQIEIQDEGSQLLACLSQAKRGEMVVDFCAGAGGKTLAMGTMMRNSGRLYAFDTVGARLNRLKPRLAKSGLSNVLLQVIDSLEDNKIKRLHGKCDCVLVDAPCSGTGTLRRQPDLKYRQNKQTVEQYSYLQRDILQAASLLLKPKGRLIYATCSLLPEENEMQINTFLQQNPHFLLGDCTEHLPSGTMLGCADKMLRLSPASSQTDGFFAAVLHHQ